MHRIRHILITAVLVLVSSMKASAQIDAILDLIFDAAEPTPVYDTQLREATENLAGKIDRLNDVLFGGAEQTSAAYRYKTMYSDLYDISMSLGNYIEHTYSNAKRLEKMYSDTSDPDYESAYWKAQDTWNIYNDSVQRGNRIIEKFKKLFSDKSTTNAEVRQGAKDALDELKAEQRKADQQALEEYVSEEIARGLAECASFMALNQKSYVQDGKKRYGTTLNSGGSSTTAGSFGTAIMVIIGLFCIIGTVYAVVNVLKHNMGAEELVARIFIYFVMSLIVILSVQSNI